MTLLNQLEVPHHSIKFDCPIYGDEEQIGQNYCQVIEDAFRRLTEATVLLAREGKVSEIDGKPLSVQDAFDYFIK
jgi:hypothetical protein